MQKLSGHAVKFAAIFLFTLLTATGASAQESALDRARAAAAAQSFLEAATLYDQAVAAAPKDRYVLVEAGDVNMSLERYNVALGLYTRAYEEASRNAEVNRKLGLAYARLGDHPRAIEAIRRAIKIDDNAIENYLALGDAYIAADSLSEAELILTQARGKYPGAMQPVVALGDLFFARRIYEGAIAQYEQALAKDPSLIEARVRLGRSYRSMGRRQGTSLQEMNDAYTRALTEFNRATQADPKNARAWFEQGEIYLLANLHKEAGQAFKAYSELRPDDPRGDIMFARAAYGGTYYLDAIPSLERVLQQNDSLSLFFRDQARSMLAMSYYADKQYPKASQLYAMVPDSSMDSLSYVLYASSIINSAGDTAQAINAYRKLVALSPEDCNLSLGLGHRFYELRRYDDAIALLDRRTIDCPTEVSNLYIGLSHYTMKRWDRAIAALTQVTASDSANLVANYWLMNAYSSNNQAAKAAEVARVITRLGSAQENPKEIALAWSLIGRSRYDAKDYKGAIDAFQSSLKLTPESISVNLFTAISYHYLKDTDNACRYYGLVLKYQPGNADARKNMATLGCK